MPREIVKIGLAVFHRDCLMLVRKRNSDYLILPGGKPEPGEDDITTLKREIDEELGCTLEPESICHLGHFRDRAANLADTGVLVKLYAGTLVGNPIPQGEIEQLFWFNPSTATSIPLAPSLTNSIVPYLIQTGHFKQNSHQAHGWEHP